MSSRGEAVDGEQRRDTLGGNARLFFLSQLASATTPVLVSILSARLLHPAGAGRFGLLAFYVLLGTTVASLGLPNAVTRFLALLGPRDGGLSVGRLLVRRGCLSGLVTGFVLAALGAASLLGPGTPLQYGLTGATVVLTTATTLLAAVLSGQEDFRGLMRVSTAVAPAAVAVNVSALAVQASVTSLLVAGLVVAGLNLGLLASSTASSSVLAEAHLDLDLRAEVRRYLVPVSLIVFLDLVVWQRSEVLFLAHLAPPRETALYVLPYGLVTRVMMLVPGALTGVLLPRFAGTISDATATEATFRRSIAAVTVVTAGLVGAGWLFAPQLLAALFGPGYAGMTPVFRLLAYSGGAGAIAGVAAAALYGLGHQNVILQTGAVIAVVNVALDVALIPHHGALGAAVANAAAQVGGITAAFVYLHRRLRLVAPWLHMLAAVGVAGIAWSSGRAVLSLTSGAAGTVLACLAYAGVWSCLLFLVPLGMAADGGRLRTRARHEPA